MPGGNPTRRAGGVSQMVALAGDYWVPKGFNLPCRMFFSLSAVNLPFFRFWSCNHPNVRSLPLR